MSVQTSGSERARAAPEKTRPPILIGVIVLLLSAAFLGYGVGHPIVLWDEARVAASGVEMSHTGLNLVVTYNYQPDTWSTKPPLAIWLIGGCVRIFGANNWAVRLPSLAAGVGVLALVMAFSWRLTRSTFTTFTAALLLVTTEGFYGVHAVMGADYDALLTFFTTGYLLLLFGVIHHVRPAPWRVALCALFVVAACLTKGVEGVLPGVGAFVYVVVRGRWPRLFKTPWYALCGLVAVVVVIGYYFLRERAAPGYLAALNESELGGHFLEAQPGTGRPLTYYPWMLFLLFAFGPLLLALFAAPFIRWPKVKSTAFLTYGYFAAAGLMIIVSIDKTKLFWYLEPIYPILAILLAIISNQVLAMVPTRSEWRYQIKPILIGTVLICLTAKAVYSKVYDLHRYDATTTGRYGAVFAQLERAGYRRFRTVDGGVINSMNRPNYNPQLRFYTLVWRDHGIDVDSGDPAHLAASGQGAVVITCGVRYLAAVRALGPNLTTVPECAATAPGPVAEARAGT